MLRPLPKRFVSSLRKLVRKSGESGFYGKMGKMLNMDERLATEGLENWYKPQNLSQVDLSEEGNTDRPGFRVRLFEHPKSFRSLKTNVIIKRLGRPDIRAPEYVKQLNRIVEAHNAARHNAGYILLKPRIYPIGKQLVAMSLTDAPNLGELRAGKTERSKRARAEIEAKCGIGSERLLNEIQDVVGRTQIWHEDIVFVGLKNRKMLFIPYAELP